MGLLSVPSTYYSHYKREFSCHLKHEELWLACKQPGGIPTIYIEKFAHTEPGRSGLFCDIYTVCPQTMEGI